MAKASAMVEQVVIKAANFKTVKLTIRGTAPLVCNRFSEKARMEMEAKQLAGDKAKGKKGREPKIPEECYKAAFHRSHEGWYGIPATAFRAGMVDACRVAGMVMTRAKMTVFVKADGFDVVDGIPLVKIHGGKPKMVTHHVRNESGVADVRHRPMWETWGADVYVKYDADQIDAQSVANLLSRAGMQVGVGEGRPFSKNSVGMGWGTYEVVGS